LAHEIDANKATFQLVNHEDIVIMHLCIFLILHFPRLRGVSRRKFRRRRPLRNHRRLLSGRNQIIDNCPTIDDRLHKGTRLRARDSATALSLTPLVVNRQPRVSVIKTDARERERERERRGTLSRRKMCPRGIIDSPEGHIVDHSCRD